MTLTPEILVQGGIGTVIIALVGVFFASSSRRIDRLEGKASGMGSSLDKKTDKESCEDHRAHQTKLNIDIIDRLARIETKVDFIRNGNEKKNGNKQ